MKIPTKTLTVKRIPGTGHAYPVWFTISHRFLDDKVDRRMASGKWFQLRTTDGTIFRILRFESKLAYSDNVGTADVFIDYHGWLKLIDYSENIDVTTDVEFKKAGWWQLMHCMVSHPDPGYRLAGWISLVSLLLGIVGLALGMIPLFK
jgi:hypothetical protein